jgi:hypothetical protein
VPFAGERFSSEVTLTPAAVAAYAHAAGDSNPVHHDPEFASSTRFGRLNREWDTYDCTSAWADGVSFLEARSHGGLGVLGSVSPGYLR